MRRIAPLLLTVALGAQEPATVGLQLRGNFPSDNLKDAVGGKAGFGASLGAESELEEAWRGRVVLGYDAFGPGTYQDQSGRRGKVSSSHLSIEVVRMIGQEGRHGFMGPYVVLGAGAYGWGVTTSDSAAGISVTRRVIHLGGSFGFGYRFSPSWDLEVRVTGGRVDPQFLASYLSLGMTFRF
ncbi:MAG: outer membrane beta-barrel protein [Acidobacteria bacterium]|nr:outer membrane beta-barrel protein [Acidobacteriota bacterium]